MSKTKGIRLSGKRLEWWENNDNAAEKVRRMIDRDIAEKEKFEKMVVDSPKILNEIEKLRQEIKNIKSVPVKKESNNDDNKVEEAENKIDNLINLG